MIALAVASVVAPVVQATPQIIEKTVNITQQVPVTPVDVIQGLQLGLVVLAGFIASFLHQLAERGRWSSQVNRLVWAAYNLAIGAGTAFIASGAHVHLDVNTGLTALTGFLVAAGSSQGRYQLFKFLSDAMASNSAATSDPTLSSGDEVLPTKPASGPVASL